MKTTREVTVEVTLTTLKLPEPFDIKPAFEVELPKECKAFIYNIKVRHDRYNQDKLAEIIDGWRVIVLNKMGRTPMVLRNRCRGDTGSDETFTNALDVKRHLEKLVLNLSKEKVTTVTEDDPE